MPARSGTDAAAQMTWCGCLAAAETRTTEMARGTWAAARQPDHDTGTSTPTRAVVASCPPPDARTDVITRTTWAADRTQG
jgi:hypothetical protein